MLDREMQEIVREINRQALFFHGPCSIIADMKKVILYLCVDEVGDGLSLQIQCEMPGASYEDMRMLRKVQIKVNCGKLGRQFLAHDGLATIGKLPISGRKSITARFDKQRSLFSNTERSERRVLRARQDRRNGHRVPVPAYAQAHLRRDYR